MPKALREALGLTAGSTVDISRYGAGLPGDIRLSGPDASRLIAERFAEPLLLPIKATRALPKTLANLGIAGGAAYDALVALAAGRTPPRSRRGTDEHAAPTRPSGLGWSSSAEANARGT